MQHGKYIWPCISIMITPYIWQPSVFKDFTFTCNNDIHTIMISLVFDIHNYMKHTCLLYHMECLPLCNWPSYCQHGLYSLFIFNIFWYCCFYHLKYFTMLVIVTDSWWVVHSNMLNTVVLGCHWSSLPDSCCQSLHHYVPLVPFKGDFSKTKMKAFNKQM